MHAFTVTLPSGVEWIPTFVTEIDPERCIGCGRCFKVCTRDVLELTGVDEDGEFVPLDLADDDDYERKVMRPVRPENCVGCRACSMVCAKKCFSHAQRFLAR